MTTAINQRQRALIKTLSPNQKRLMIARARRLVPDTALASGGTRLLACVQSNPEAELEASELRSFCEARLPSYMVPQIFAMMDELPRTAAGKTDRRALQLQSLTTSGSHHADTGTAPRNALEEQLVAIWNDVLGMDDLTIHDNFFEMGGDSLQIIRILSRTAKLGMRIKPDTIFAHPTIAELAALHSVSESGAATKGNAEKLQLLPIQHWFFEHIKTDQHHWNQSLLFALDAELTLPQLTAIVARLLQHHEALRSVFSSQNGTWNVHLDKQDAKLPVQIADLSQIKSAAVQSAISTQATRFNAELNLQSGPLFRVILFKTAAELPDHLLIVAHHLVIDGESWRLLTEDFSQLMRQQRRGEELQLTPVSATISSWSSRLADYANSEKIAEAKRYWSRIQTTRLTHLPVDATDGHKHLKLLPAVDNREKHVAVLTSRLESETTALLTTQVSQQLNTRVNVLLVTALAQVLAKWTSAATVGIDMEGHGRENLFDDLDISRTIGWFTSVFPLWLHAPDESDWQQPHTAIKIVKEAITALPLNGMSHGMLGTLSSDPSVRAWSQNQTRPQVLFNYLGRTDHTGEDSGGLTLVDERCGQARSDACERAYLLELNARIQDGELRVDWSYNSGVHQAATIAALAEQFCDRVKDIVSGAASGQAAPISVPADFPLAGLDQQELDNLAGLLDGLDED